MRDVRITGTGQLLNLSRDLRRAGGSRLQRNFARRIRRAAEPLRDGLQTAVRTVPIRSQGGSGRSGPSPTTRPLRATIAEAIRISVRVSANPGARIWIDRGALPPDMRAMPNKIDEARWRHPVFGNRKRWATQYAAPWWDVTIRRHTARMAAEVERVLDDVQRDLS
ncbi:hypothetical protein [Streptomyces rapamycinicus]|uniref:HK97 gp10 family phage protein n=2 Tax=Streptomyces rapamycinicus TaxID=1226757 RepID=A0A0A0NJA3_STRRN|nr:hypothetical protein [Streptomyces rapamycinicus]AGP56188.1 hypothetical protein M271_23385 [Streptomyces rapamycinicus NRRL 5491]MBB4783797.1 hypothetical protein [Streptomyces rapamycinicus]RLV80731.1 hypothetical protein D3C57_120140 [Streptomyces rapamycinicus NRRL 5491]UTO64154.1 hypothetical protein LJB45_18680 [Streptomyces rapamycinicus]UTP32109.1 hypothetical protein LIV37_23800 [Streptomyces rapamycinicus NRRL 5491]